ncbi:MAG: molybdopterin oxidoreductase [Spirochaetes bacterium RBG_16_49_21]|nr:MAG: molybdopterin oxidoreductase [Spirochaetes bacterium RBG_16_49_21]
MKNKKLTRRSFVKGATGTLLGGGIAALAGIPGCGGGDNAVLKSSRPDSPSVLNNPENIIYTACLNCNTGCGIKVKIQNNVGVKIDGNPYNPFNLVPNIPMSSSLDEAAAIDAPLCPKGQAGVQTVYDPYRIMKVLKRDGSRGHNRWKSIPFARAVKEIVEGGRLFAHVEGEENRTVEGLRSIMAFRDEGASKEMAGDIQKYWDEKDAARKTQFLDAFRRKYARHLGAFIDPNHPDLGPKNNQLVIAWGRLKGGRSDFIKRFGAGFGTTNLHGHTTVCQGSLYFTCKAISEQYVDGKFKDGQKFYWQTDLEHARYVLFVGANLFEANYGPTNRAARLTANLADGSTKISVADPRFSKLASKAHKWLPVKPGEDAALAMAVIRWIIDNRRYDERFLRCANKAAAKASGEKSWSNATWLVEIKDGKPGKMVRGEGNTLCVSQNGGLVFFDPNSEAVPVYGDLFVDRRIEHGGKTVAVKSSLQLLKESAGKNAFRKWCEIAGIEPRDIEEVARELTSYGKRASVDIHRGPAQHTNGFYNVLSWMSVNMLLGNFDWKGGMIAASAYGYDGKKGGPFDLTKVKGKIEAFGVSSIRHGIAYEKTSLFQGYPAKRNWYPLSSDVYEEIVPSIGDAYPYPVKALILYMGTPAYSLPAGHTNIEVLADVKRLPLFIANDITIGTSSMYADYIFPDLSYLERWEFQGSHPNMPDKVQPVRQPSIAPIPETVRVYGGSMPISLEAMLMAFAEALGLKAFGADALGNGLHLKRPEDLYLRGVANVAVGDAPGKEVPDADEREIKLFVRSRRHLPPSVFDAGKWEAVCGPHWKKAVYVLNRGGRFEDHAKVYDGDQVKHAYGKLLNLYQEKTAGNKYSGSGKSYPGIATYLPQLNYKGETLDALSKGYDLHLITNRTVTQTKSRTTANYWLKPFMPENGIIINRIDAERLGLDGDDIVKVVSATNPAGEWDLKNGTKKTMKGRVVITEDIRPGVISFVLGFGHWATGAADMMINGEKIAGDPQRGTGIHANAAMWTDPTLRNNTCLIDPVGGSVSFYDTKVRLIKV